MIDRRPLGNVLVAIDFSQGSRRAIERACRLPVTRGSALTLLHVMPRVHPSLADRAQAAARATLERWMAEARAAVPTDVAVFGAIEAGAPFEEICRRADGERDELVVLGRHGDRSWPQSVLGGTAERVLRHGQRAVLLVADGPVQPYRRPLIAVDAERSSDAALELMARVTAPGVLTALAVHVHDFAPLVFLSRYGVSEQELEPYRRSQAEATRAELTRQLGELGGTALGFDLRFIDGDPRDAILRAARAERADLVAVGTHGRSGVRHLLFGSVAEAVIRHADVDVLVARMPR